MKTRSKITTLLAGVIGLVFSMYGSGAFAAIALSAHDFTNGGNDAWNTSGELCVICHTPHNAGKAGAAAVANDTALWNRIMSPDATTYTVYNSATLDAGTPGQPQGISKLCLSCHDGTVALDSFGGNENVTVNNTTNVEIYGAARNFGTDLSNDHPISLTVPVTAEFNTPTSAVLYGVGNDQVECASCHDVHNGAGLANLLRVSNSTLDGGTASGLCFDCHNK